MKKVPMTDMASLEVIDDVAMIYGVLDFTSVVALLPEGKKWLTDCSSSPCIVDFSGVSQCNSAATALLLDWLRTGKAQEKQISIVNVPQKLRDLMRLAGLEDVLATEVI